MSFTTKNHYVQQAYLKNFSYKGVKKQIWVFDKLPLKPSEEKKSIKDVAQEMFFYPQWLEEWLNKQVESPGISSIRKLIENKNFYLLEELEKKNLLEWIHIQFVRTPSFQNLIQNSFKEFLEKAKEEDHPYLPSISIQDFENLENKLHNLPTHVPILKRLLWYYIENKNNFNYKLLSNYRWSLFEHKEKTEFYTSDNPVIINHEDPHNVRLNLSFLWFENGPVVYPAEIKVDIPKAFNFYIPLTPNLLLYIHDPKYSYKSYNIIKNVKNVYGINEMITVQSYRYIFSHTKKFDHAITAIKKFPKSKYENYNNIGIAKFSGDSIVK